MSAPTQTEGSTDRNESRPYTSLLASNGSFDLPMHNPTPIDPNEIETASLIVHVDDDPTYMQELLQNPINRGIGHSSVLKGDDAILNGIHVECIQVKDESVDESITMSLEVGEAK